MKSQHFISGLLLLAVRQTEAQRGTLLAHHGRHPAALRPTQPRFHKIMDRRARKLAARYRCAVAVEAQRRTGEPWSRLNQEDFSRIDFAPDVDRMLRAA